MNRIVLILIILLSTKVFAEEAYLERLKTESIAVLSSEIGSEKVSELVIVKVEARSFLTSAGRFATGNIVTFVDPKSETQRTPKQNTPLNLEARMAELEARTHEGASPTIYVYNSYVVLTGSREKIHEETYDSFFAIKKQP